MSRAGGSSSGAALAVGAALGLGAAAAAALAVALLSGHKGSKCVHSTAHAGLFEYILLTFVLEHEFAAADGPVLNNTAFSQGAATDKGGLEGGPR